MRWQLVRRDQSLPEGRAPAPPPPNLQPCSWIGQQHYSEHFHIAGREVRWGTRPAAKRWRATQPAHARCSWTSCCCGAKRAAAVAMHTVVAWWPTRSWWHGCSWTESWKRAPPTHRRWPSMTAACCWHARERTHACDSTSQRASSCCTASTRCGGAQHTATAAVAQQRRAHAAYDAATCCPHAGPHGAHHVRGVPARHWRLAAHHGRAAEGCEQRQQRSSSGGSSCEHSSCADAHACVHAWRPFAMVHRAISSRRAPSRAAAQQPCGNPAPAACCCNPATLHQPTARSA